MLRTWILLLAITGACSSGDLDGDERCDSLPQQGRGTLHGVACLQAKQKGLVKNLEEEQPTQMNLQAKMKGWDQNLEEEMPRQMNFQAKMKAGVKNLEEEQPSQMNLQAKLKGWDQNLEEDMPRQMNFHARRRGGVKNLEEEVPRQMNFQAERRGGAKNLEEEKPSQMNPRAKLKGWHQYLEEEKPSQKNLHAKMKGGVKNLEEEQPSQMNLQPKLKGWDQDLEEEVPPQTNFKANRRGGVKNLEEVKKAFWRFQDEASKQMAFGTCDPPADTQILPMVSESDAQKFIFSSALHTIVGDDGVVMLSLGRDLGRYGSAYSHWTEVGVKPMLLAATDGHCASDISLAKGCAAFGQCDDWEKTGTGCVSRSEQAIADSHRRALEFAQNRGNEWTLIMEDDAIPVIPDGVNWDASLRAAWAKVPSDARIVRLAWCRFDAYPDDLPGDEVVLVGDFKFTRGREESLGGCTTAALYHKSIIPEYLKIFPCCGALDACHAFDFYFRPQAVSADNPEGKRYVDRVLWNLQLIDSPQVISTLQDGVLYGRNFGIIMPSGLASNRDF